MSTNHIHYKFMALCLRLLLMLVIKSDCANDPLTNRKAYFDLERDVRNTISTLESLSE